MLTINGVQLRMNSIIELCVLPDMKVHDMMVRLSTQVQNALFLDTVGNLRFAADASYILSRRKLVKTLLSLRCRHGFVLFIDSISVLGDRSVHSMQRVSNILWMLVYNHDATIVVSNHYRVVHTPGFAGFVPRLGSRWRMMVSYRLMFKYTGNEVSVDVHTNELFADSDK